MLFKTIPHIYSEGKQTRITEKKLWLAEVNDINGCELKCILRHSKEGTLTLKNHWRGLIALDVMALKINKGTLRFFEIDIMKMAKLQVFLDHAISNTDTIETDELCWASFPDTVQDLNPDEMEYWLLNQAMRPAEDSKQLVQFLRETECYNLVHFLLSATDDNDQCLQNLCVRYGLSAAHFRRLSRHALGHTTKVTLREWRMTKAVLAFINDPHNMTDVAFAHGYSSLSHFSNDVKKMLGMTPRALRKSIIDMAMK
ncbi:helix-turn-helix domain-containing protein [Rouxiella sp. T17]|uniref:helix-turn-helix domain-containing protein n=1 Tax=Rouxiella sp. T17 TaxID=3085684 RepID=UPI002FC98D5E